jgi:SAM-dependent methyltransferase
LPVPQLEPAGVLSARPAFPDFRSAPNIGGHPAVYQLENQALDQAGHVLDALRCLAPWAGKTIVDLGCGTGFWLPRYAVQASRVIGLEPHAPTRATAIAAAANRPGVEIRAGSAEHTGLPDASVDIIHARFAYFFPPGCEAGLTEALRVLRPGGHLIMVDNDYRWGEFSRLLAAASSRPPEQVAARVDEWWRARGGTRHEVRSELRFARRQDLAAVLHIEFPAEVARAWLARNPLATGLTYGYVLHQVTRPRMQMYDAMTGPAIADSASRGRGYEEALVRPINIDRGSRDRGADRTDHPAAQR